MVSFAFIHVVMSHVGMSLFFTRTITKPNKIPDTVNFQNNAQVQINAWFKLTPGTKHTVYNYNTVFCISKERLVQFNAWSDAI